MQFSNLKFADDIDVIEEDDDNDDRSLLLSFPQDSELIICYYSSVFFSYAVEFLMFTTSRRFTFETSTCKLNC